MARWLALSLLALAVPATAEARLHLVPVARFRAPVYVTAPPGDRQRLFVVERAGRIVIWRHGRKLHRPFLDLRGQVSTEAEQGLLSMAFAPDYSRSGRFYVDYTDRDGDIQVQELRRSRDPNLAAVRSRRRLLEIEHSRFPHHIGGQLAFGPDRMLYIGVGDGGGIGDPLGSGQNLGTLLAKILRIDPRPSGSTPYRIPQDNPFARAPGARPETYAYGLRNPWRFSFDRRTGDLAIGDVGEDQVEEVDFARRGAAAGANFGWSVMEGNKRRSRAPLPSYAPPVIVHPHRDGFCAIIGGYVARDRSLGRLYGRYVYGDDCSPRIWSAKLGPGRASGDRPSRLRVRHLVSFGEDVLGRLYAVSLRGPVYRLAG